MNWNKVREFYGLKRPFDFNVAIPFLLNGSVLILILVVCLSLFFNGSLGSGTARFYFFLYIACLLAIAAALSRARRLSYAILCWCTIELSLALGSSILAKYKAVPSLFPENASAAASPWSIALVYHPLLQSVPRPNWQFKDHWDLGAHEAQAKAAGIDAASLRNEELYFVHNSQGFRGKELTEDDLAKDIILIYGGSTTYDIAVTQGETWVERLQADLNNKYTVLNLGVPGHSTVEHLIQTAFYQDIVKKKPVCAVYYVGWNDVGSSHIEHLDSAYADYHLLLQAERKPSLSLASYSPLFLLANGLAVRRFDTVPLYPTILGKPPVAGPDDHLEALFVEHIKTIAAINRARDIKVIFIGQILNRRWPDVPGDWFPLVKASESVPLVERLKSLLKATAASIGTKYIDPGVTNFEGNDFVDGGHFSAPGAKKFAALVSEGIGDYCR